MSPSKKNFAALTSSNNIIWEGEPLPCILLCTGDVVSDVIYKLAIEICAMKKAYNLKDLDLKTVFTACIACPQPVKTLQNVFQLIINKIMSMDAIIAAINSTGTSSEEINIVLASCFLPYVNSNGDTLTKLPQSNYTRLLATKVCSVITSVNGIVIRVNSLETNVAIMAVQIAALGTEATVTSCLQSTAIPVPISTAYTTLDTQFCALSKALGTPTKLLKSYTAQPTGLKDLTQLGGNNAPMSAINSNGISWISTVSTGADSITNMWLTVMDMRGAVQAMQDNCCKVSCDSITIDFSVKLNDARTIAYVYFASKSKIPTGFYDCDTSLGNKLTITDALGNTTYANVKLANLVNYTLVNSVMTEPYATIDLSSTSIAPSSDYTFSMDACLTNGTMTCQKCITKSVTYKDTCSYCEISVTAGASLSGSLTIAYQENNTSTTSS